MPVLEFFVNDVLTYQCELSVGSELVFGREGYGADVSINDTCVSKRHLSVLYTNNVLIIKDHNSTNGTFIEGQRLFNEIVISENKTIHIGKEGNYMLNIIFDENSLRNSTTQSKMPQSKTNKDYQQTITKAKQIDRPSLNDFLKKKNSIVIGRLASSNADADILVDDPDKIVSRHHACIYKDADNVYVEDLNSTNGTYINGKRIFKKTKISEADVLHIGHFSFTLSGAYRDRNLEPAIQAVGIEKFYDNKHKVGLHKINLEINRQEFVAMMGPSGCGKSTLLKALNGDSPPTDGLVKIHGLELMSNYQYIKRRIGYVPQDDIVHKDLTVERSLYYAGKLRLGEKASEEFIKERIDDVLGMLNINREDIRKKRISELSGGQRKRVSIAVEMLNSPSILFLDEPTSPLDPETIDEFLKCIKSLTRLGTTVVMVTHKPEDLNYVDKVIMLTTKGYHAYYGDKGEALFKYFETDNIIGIYNLLSKETDINKWYDKCKASYSAVNTTTPKSIVREKAKNESAFSQFYWLAKRYLNIKLNDKLNSLLMLSQPIIIAVLIAYIFKDMQIGILFMMAITSIWFGVSNSAKEIVGEMPIFRRERMFNLRILTYLFSKIFVLTAFATIQVLIFVGIIYLRYKNDIPEGLDRSLSLPYYWGNASFLLYLSLSATLMGLLLSSIFDNAEKVMTIVPIVLIPQIMLAGVIAKPEDKITEAVSYVTLGRWGTEGLARIQDSYYVADSISAEGSVVAYMPEYVSETIFDEASQTNMIVQKPTNKMIIAPRKAMDMLDLYNDKLMALFKSEKIYNTILMITLINIITFIALYYAIKRKDSI